MIRKIISTTRSPRSFSTSLTAVQNARSFDSLFNSKLQTDVIDYGGVKAVMNDKNTVLVDVRQPEEYVEGTIENALNIPLDKLVDSMEELDKNKNVIVFCRSGKRSFLAQQILKQSGFPIVFNYEGSYVDWVSQEPSQSAAEEKS